MPSCHGQRLRMIVRRVGLVMKQSLGFLVEGRPVKVQMVVVVVVEVVVTAVDPVFVVIICFVKLKKE